MPNRLVWSGCRRIRTCREWLRGSVIFVLSGLQSGGLEVQEICYYFLARLWQCDLMTLFIIVEVSTKRGTDFSFSWKIFDRNRLISVVLTVCFETGNRDFGCDLNKIISGICISLLFLKSISIFECPFLVVIFLGRRSAVFFPSPQAPGPLNQNAHTYV